MAVQLKISKQLVQEEKENKESIETSASVISSNNLNAPKHGTVIPNRVFVGGISSATTEHDLAHLFSSYGNVTGTKIISDRAGVSKGYGFVTFETEDEAKRLQKEADNIVFKDRRLNIAPAIKKQGFSRGGYDCATPSPMPCTSQVYRHNGVTFTFHNGMAFFPQPPQPAPQAVTQTAHVETSPVFQQGASYGAVAPSSPGPAYPFSYAPQGQLYYQAPPYQYHLPQYDGCYDTNQVMVADGSLVVPQYYNYIAPQPTHEIYFQPAPIHTQDPAQSVQPIIYASPRAYDSTIVYSSEPKCAMENGMGSQNGGGVISKEEADCSTHPTNSATVSTTTAPTTLNHNNTSNNNNTRRSRETTPVVSLLKFKEHKEQHFQARRKQQDVVGRRQFHLNNNNPDTTNRNLKQQTEQRGAESRRTPPPVSTYPGGGHASRPPPPPVPQYPFYPRQILAPPSSLSSFYQHPHPPPPPAPQPIRSRSYHHRPRYNGGGRGRGGKWISKEEEVGNPLTPPITPRSESTSTATTTVTQTDDVVQSIQALAI